MRISVNDNRVSRFTLLGDRFSEGLIDMMQHDGRFIKGLSVFEIPDDSKSAWFIKTIDELLDRYGIHAVSYIRVTNEVSTVGVEKFIKSNPKPDIAVNKKDLIVYDNIEEQDIGNNSKIQFVTQLSDKADEKALSILDSVNLSRRVHVSYSPSQRLYYVWCVP